MAGMLIGCESRPELPIVASPAALLETIDKQIISGELLSAEKAGSSALLKYANDPSWSASFSLRLAKIHMYKGENQEAVTLLNSVHPADSAQYIRQNVLLALTEAQLGHKQNSNHAMSRVENLETTRVLKAEILGAKGSLYVMQGNLERAETLFQAALADDTLDRVDFHAAQMLLNLGVVALQREQFTEAVNRLNEAAVQANKINARLILEKSLSSLSWAYYRTGDLTRALETGKGAEQAANAVGARIDRAQLLINAGKIQFQLHNPIVAEASLNQALSLSRDLNNPEKQLSAHLALGYLLLEQRPGVAAIHIQKAAAMSHDQQDASEEMESSFLQGLLFVHEGNFDGALGKLENIAGQPNAAPSLRWEAENTLAALHDGASHPRLAELWYQRAIETFHQQRLTLKSVELELPFLENGTDLYMGYMEHLIRAGRTEQALALLDTSRAETLAEGLGAKARKPGKAADPRTVAARLHATVLVYCLRPDRSYLWAITGKEQRFYILPGSGAILPLVARHNEAILGARDLLAQKDSTGRALYDALLAPAAGLLPKNGGRVVLVADSALSRLNFETLVPPGDSPHYWIEDVSVTNARSLRLLAASHRPPSAEAKPEGAKMLLIGDPVYAKEEYAPLPNAHTEMEQVAGHFSPGETMVATGRQASPEAYATSRPGRFQFVHFVAHATASELNPLDSAVILSGNGEGGGAANKLYASEILKQPLSAELVTLSSCYGSGVRNYTGEGVVGLVWAFLRAGAHSVIGALWDVSDVATPKLMDTLYRRVLAGDAPDAALRQAKLEMLHSEGVFRKPVYWGAFQLYAGR